MRAKSSPQIFFKHEKLHQVQKKKNAQNEKTSYNDVPRYRRASYTKARVKLNLFISHGVDTPPARYYITRNIAEVSSR